MKKLLKAGMPILFLVASLMGTYTLIQSADYETTGRITSVTLQDRYPLGTEVITVRYKSHFSAPLTFGTGFGLERERDGRWERMEYTPEGGLFNYVLLFIKPGEDYEIPFYIKFHFAPSEPGRYRFYQRFSPPVNSGEEDEFFVYTEFELY